jgi:hypothetical protein
MAIVSFTVAKAHLRVTDLDHDADIETKLEQASAIIMDYLKNRLTAIASISAANPTVITTSVPHSLVSGTTYTLAGTTTTPTVNGARVVTVTSPTTFTVPVNVTIGQADAAGTVGSPAWTETTAPTPVQSAILLMLTHLYENRGDDMDADDALWMSLGNMLCRFRDPALA